MKRMIPILLTLCLILTGCGDLLSGSYHNVTGNEVAGEQTEEQTASASRYEELYYNLVEMIREGKETGTISVARYDQNKVTADTHDAIREVMLRDPLGAYAVEKIDFELGTSGGQPAVALKVTYRHSRSEILKIRRLSDGTQMLKALAGAMDRCDAGIVMYVEQYDSLDFDLWVSTYAALNPDKVMEQPEISAAVYPEEGRARVVEVKFHYQNSRDVLRAMKTNVEAQFAYAAELSMDVPEAERFGVLYRHLLDPEKGLEMEKSITPAYSLLFHDVGDARTVAQVYTALCTRAGLECATVTGTKSGAPWYWNIVCRDGVYYHADLLADLNADLQFRTDEEMAGYVWDYSAYQACGLEPEVQSEE